MECVYSDNGMKLSNNRYVSFVLAMLSVLLSLHYISN